MWYVRPKDVGERGHFHCRRCGRRLQILRGGVDAGGCPSYRMQVRKMASIFRWSPRERCSFSAKTTSVNFAGLA